MLYKPKILYQRKRPAALIYAVVFNSSYSAFLVMLLFASFMMQPIHKAYANDAVLDPESVDETLVAEPVSMQSEEPAEPEVTEEPETALEEETVSTDDVVAEEEPADTSNADESVAEETSDNTEGELGDANDADNDSATSSPETTGDDETDEDTTTDTTDDETATSTDTTSEDEEDTSTASSTDDTTATSTDSTNNTTNGTSTDSGNTGGTGGSADESEEENADTVDEDTTEIYDDSDDSEVTEDNDTSTTTEESAPEATDIVEDMDEEVDTAIATDTPLIVMPGETVDAQSLITDDNYYQFGRNSCVAIGDGTFHCSQKTESGIDLNAVAYSELGPNKNLEIFLRGSDGEVRQITDNEFDDSAPHYDAESMQIVWQRQIDGKYQVVLYDINEDEEDQLTFSRTNNMEPKVSKDGIVWQAWDGNDWEIMYFDGTYTDQLTDNFTQDVTPAINEGYILWSVLGGEEQEARVYSLDSEEILTINGYEGGVISNPRFVLVYDTMYDNGDVVTQGFDPETGLSAPIAAQPVEDPIDLPDTDGTGETRALIQNKASEKDELNPDGTKNDVGTTTPNGVGTTTNAVDDTLDLTAPVETATTSTDEIAVDEEVVEETAEPEEYFELTDFDLILEPEQSTTTEEASTSTESEPKDN